MGCDIHTHFEFKRTYNNEKKWYCGDYFTLNHYFKEDDPEYGEKYELVQVFKERNYSIFATLANVRNYGNTPYISQPKGLPHDVTAETKKDSDYWGCDGHSHSYLTLRELLDFRDSAPPLKHRGMISPYAQKALDEEGKKPEMWCQCTNQAGWDWREWEEPNWALDELIEAMKRRAAELHLIYEFTWEQEPEKAYEQANDVRLVFWFDN